MMQKEIMKTKERKAQNHKIKIMKQRNFNYCKMKEKLIRQKKDRIFAKTKEKNQKIGEL